MNDIMLRKENGQILASSREVAEKFGKKHSEVIYAIEGRVDKNGKVKNNGLLISGISQLSQMFIKSEYVDTMNRTQYEYLMNRDGFSLLAMGFTGKKALEWKLQYIKAFNQMEHILNEKSTDMWIETRKQGKITRKSETDVIKQLIEYAKKQGSEHSDKLYITYSKLANKMAGITKRDEATVSQLNNLSLIENIILNCIQNGISLQKHYKQIYQDCKRRLEMFKDIAYLEQVSQKWRYANETNKSKKQVRRTAFQQKHSRTRFDT